MKRFELYEQTSKGTNHFFNKNCMILRDLEKHVKDLTEIEKTLNFWTTQEYFKIALNQDPDLVLYISLGQGLINLYTPELPEKIDSLSEEELLDFFLKTLDRYKQEYQKRIDYLLEDVQND